MCSRRSEYAANNAVPAAAMIPLLPLVPPLLGMVLGRILDDKFRASLARVRTLRRYQCPIMMPRRSSRSGPISNRISSGISIRLRRRRNQANSRSCISRRTLS